MHYDVWSTAWGPVGAAAAPGGLTRLVLPHQPAEQILTMLAGQDAHAVRNRDAFQRLRDLTRAYFDGREVDFQDIPCMLPSAERFAGKVLRACRAIPYGRTVCYSWLAARVGNVKAARAVASAMSRNPIPLVVPCHRITYADGRLGGFSAAGGPDLKGRLLALEGVQIDP